MANKKRLIDIGDTLYIIGKYSFSPDEAPKVVKVQVAYRYRKSYYSYPTNNHGSFKFNNSDLGKTVFFNSEDAERTLRRFLDASY